MKRETSGKGKVKPRARSMDEIEAMVEQCRDCDDMAPYVWHPMDDLHEYMEDHGHGMQDLLGMLTGDFTVDDDRFQIDYMGHLVSCTEMEYHALLVEDAYAIERIWTRHGPTDDQDG